MRTASPPYARHVGEVHDLLAAGESHAEISAAIEDTELAADAKTALCLVVSRSDDRQAEASEETRRESAIAHAKRRAWRLALDRRIRRRPPADGRVRYGNATRYGESGELVSPPRATLTSRVRRLLHP
jgi:hypothetical protein